MGNWFSDTRLITQYKFPQRDTIIEDSFLELSYPCYPAYPNPKYLVSAVGVRVCFAALFPKNQSGFLKLHSLENGYYARMKLCSIFKPNN